MNFIVLERKTGIGSSSLALKIQINLKNIKTLILHFPWIEEDVFWLLKNKNIYLTNSTSRDGHFVGLFGNR